MWIAFSKNKAVKTSTERTVPLTNAMLAVVPNESDTPDELAALIEEQAAEKAEDERRHTRRHGSS
jgi:antitoxin component of MazEF toxin-antitoxin module